MSTQHTTGHNRFLLLLLTWLLVGCLDFGPNVETTTPSAEEVARARAEMYINPDLNIRPEGFKLTSGIDDAIWFKFTAEADTISTVFQSDIVDTAPFTEGQTFYNSALPGWWDTEDQSLTGGQVSLPYGRFMSVGYAPNEDGTLTVYIFWHET